MRSELLAHRTLTPKLLQKPGIVPGCCARRRDERLRMRSELLAQQARRPSLDGTLARGTRWARSPPDMAS